MRAQIWSLDFAASMVIFALTVGIVMFSWNYTIQNSADQVNLNILENDVMMISDTLIRMPGLPEDWDASSVRVIGLADEENILNKTKVTQFIGMDYNQTKSLLGIANHEFYFEIRHLNDSVMGINGTNITKGTDPTGQDASVVVPVERYVMINGDIAKMEFYLWF
jgi:hypothetical protein